MSDDVFFGSRKSKNDKKAKRRNRVYKRGGRDRSRNE